MNLKALRKRDYAFLGTWAFYLYAFLSGFGMDVSPPFYFFGRGYIIGYGGLDYMRTVADPGPTFFQYLPKSMPYFEKVFINLEYNIVFNALTIELLTATVLLFAVYVFVGLVLRKKKNQSTSTS